MAHTVVQDRDGNLLRYSGTGLVYARPGEKSTNQSKSFQSTNDPNTESGGQPRHSCAMLHADNRSRWREERLMDGQRSVCAHGISFAKGNPLQPETPERNGKSVLGSESLRVHAGDVATDRPPASIYISMSYYHH